jgi:glycosyltransferase involved in cell wall biosynthesis
MKVLFVLTYYRPHWTGLTKYAARLAEELAKKNHDIRVFCVQHKKNLSREEIVKEVKISRVPYKFRFIRSLVAPSLLFQLWKKIGNRSVVVFYLPFLEILPASIIVKLRRKKLFLVHNGDLVLPKKSGITGRLVEQAYYLNTNLAIMLSDGMILQTRDYAENSKLLSRWKDKWNIILPLYQVEKTTREQVEDFKKKHKLRGKKLIGFSGRFVEEKGINYLLETIPSVTSKIPKVHFVFAGDYKIKYEKYWNKIKPLVIKSKKHITLLGLLDDEQELAVFYKSLSVFVQPSRTDCFPSAQVEAMLLGTPVVCTDIPGARWVVKHTKMGVLVKPYDSKALEKGIIKVLKNPQQYIKPREEVEKVFNYEKNVSKYESLIKS